MCDISANNSNSPQCQYFVVRKKRLCRMTVRPGRQYCGEHEPQPRTEKGKDDTRIPCPLDSKHTCYASKLEKHLSICNARPTQRPPYIEPNINGPPAPDDSPRRPLHAYPRDVVAQVIDKVNKLYEEHIEANIMDVEEREIHPAVRAEFSAADRAESSRRHLRQASALLRLAEDQGLVKDDTCYVELGAGKGQLSYYMATAWCDTHTRSSVLSVDRAALRHKRDNAAPAARRLRADLADLVLQRAPPADSAAAIVGLAKHLCGVATDYALRCAAAAGARGLVLAACCHHRCTGAGYVAKQELQELGISAEEMNVILGIVSWATCGDGRSRERRQLQQEQDGHIHDEDANEESNGTIHEHEQDDKTSNNEGHMSGYTEDNKTSDNGEELEGKVTHVLRQEERAEVGRRAKALLDWARVLWLRRRGLAAGLRRFVPRAVSPENTCIVALRRHPDTAPETQ